MRVWFTETNWFFGLGVGDGVYKPIYVIVEIMQKDQLSQQHQKIDKFLRPSVVKAQGNIGIEKLTDAGRNCSFAIFQYSQAYGEYVSCFKRLAKESI